MSLRTMSILTIAFGVVGLGGAIVEFAAQWPDSALPRGIGLALWTAFFPLTVVLALTQMRIVKRKASETL